MGQHFASLETVLYTAKCFWPGVTDAAVRLALARAGAERVETLLRGALYFPADELVLCVFESSSQIRVKQASEQAGLPCERVMETVWVEPPGRPFLKGAS